MYNRIKITFLLLILFQGLHSVEEYYGKLWAILIPARIISRTISSNPETGFIIINIGLFIFGLFCWIISTRQRKISFKGLIWTWIIIETFNGIGHPLLALRQKSYFPGLFTAPFLLILALYLVKLLLSYPQKMPPNTAH